MLPHDLAPKADDAAQYGFGLTSPEVERLRRILTRLEARDVSLEEAWGRAAEIMALAKTMLAILAKHPPELTPRHSSKVDPREVLTAEPA